MWLDWPGGQLKVVRSVRCSTSFLTIMVVLSPKKNSRFHATAAVPKHLRLAGAGDLKGLPVHPSVSGPFPQVVYTVPNP